MNKIAKLLCKVLFNKRQRETIQKALEYSAYGYRKNGNIDKAVLVQTVINETSGLLDIVQKSFTKEDVDIMLNSAISEAYRRGVRKGVLSREACNNSPILTAGTVIDIKKCEKCKDSDKCFIYSAINEIENADTDANNSTDSAESEESNGSNEAVDNVGKENDPKESEEQKNDVEQ